MSIRENGFGLNFDQGFGSRSGGTVSTFDRQGASDAWNMLGQKRQQDFNAGQGAANRGLQQYLGDQGNATQRYGVDQQAATAREGNQMQFNLGMTGLNQKQGRFDKVFGLFGDTLQNGGGLFGSGMSGGYRGAGQVGNQPRIDSGPVYSPEMIQQQVNAARSGNDAASAGQARQMQASVAGRGFGTNSPLAQALQGNLFAKNLAMNTANERDTRMGAAQTNSDHVLKAQQAQEGQFASRQQEDIERHKAYTGGLASLLGAFGSMVG